MPDKSQLPMIRTPRFMQRWIKEFFSGTPTPPRKTTPTPAPPPDATEQHPRPPGALGFKATKAYADGRQKGQRPNIYPPTSRPRSVRRAIANARARR